MTTDTGPWDPAPAPPTRTLGRIPAERRRPTMRDVALHAGVSLKTVSRVVNDEPGVSATLTGQVRRSVETLGFRPHVGARTLRRADGKTQTVALLLEDVSNPYSAAVQRAVEDVAVPRGVMVFSVSLEEDPDRERELARSFADRRADGLILVPAGHDQSYLQSDLDAGTAIVCVDRQASRLDVDSVISTNAPGAAQAVRHLAASGHRRIAFLGDRTTILTAGQRHAGYLQALDEVGMSANPAHVVHEVGDVEQARAAVTALLTSGEPPTALFTAQNLVTIGAVRALRDLGLEHRVALVGFDDFPLADLLSPGVSVIAQDPATIGRTAAQIMFERLDGDPSPPRTHVIATRLITRGSGEIRP
jgi:LacI family transcriptional regulator